MRGTPLVMALSFAAVGRAVPQDAVDVAERVAAALEEVRAELIEIRHDIHRHPELSTQEERTAALVAKELREIGFAVRTGIGGHGVVARLAGTGGGTGAGPTVAFRADMDAVPSDMPDPAPFASEVPGVRHICGHDVHTTVGLALAHAMMATRDAWSGELLLIFQPAEERAIGARAMLDDGLFENSVPDAFFAFHSSPLEVGTVGVTLRQALPGRDRVQVRLSGAGDLSVAGGIASECVAAVTTLEPGARSVMGDFVLANVWGSRAAGEEWLVNAGVTSSGLDASRLAEKTLEASLRERLPADVSFDLVYDARTVSGIYNDPELVDACEGALLSVVGADGYVKDEGATPAFSEDFGFFQDLSHGVMFWLGVSNTDKGIAGMPHSPDFAADDESIFWGAKAMAAVLIDYLNRTPGGAGR